MWAPTSVMVMILVVNGDGYDEYDDNHDDVNYNDKDDDDKDGDNHDDDDDDGGGDDDDDDDDDSGRHIDTNGIGISCSGHYNDHDNDIDDKMIIMILIG